MFAQPCGVPAGMMMMSPASRFRDDVRADNRAAAGLPVQLGRHWRVSAERLLLTTSTGLRATPEMM
jgi:hypothetical protein